MIDHERFEVRFPNPTMKTKFHVQNVFCYTLDWTLQMSILLRFRVAAVDVKTQLMCVAERTLNVVEYVFEGWETFG